MFVTSRPPATAQRGQTFAYQIALRCRAATVRYRLEAAPEGMRLEPGCRLTWAVPADFAAASANVVLNLRSDTGQECYHVFRIGVER